jgi:hypothetical protein
MGAVAMRGNLLYIPANEKNHRVTAKSDPLPVDVQALSIFPHMHNVGREMKVDAELPNGKTLPMIWIKDWDFNWQGAYYYKEPVKLPKGTVLKLEAVYDNSTDNPRNPNNPPKLVHWGEQTTDEMCLCGVSVVTETMAELKQLTTMRNNRLGTLLGGGASPDVLKDATESKKDGEIPAGGVPIPERFKELLSRYDKNGDGKLSAEEIEAMPERLKERVKEAIKNGLSDKKP